MKKSPQEQWSCGIDDAQISRIFVFLSLSIVSRLTHSQMNAAIARGNKA